MPEIEVFIGCPFDCHPEKRRTQKVIDKVNFFIEKTLLN